MRNQASATATGVDDCEIMVCHIETMGRLAKPSMVAKCIDSDGFSVEEPSMILDKPNADLTHFMRMKKNPDGDYEKIVGCLEVGIGLGPKQLVAHDVYNLSPMTTSPVNTEAGNAPTFI